MLVVMLVVMMMLMVIGDVDIGDVFMIISLAFLHSGPGDETCDLDD